jgi:signal peptidase I
VNREVAMDDSNELRRLKLDELAAQVLRDSGKLRFRATGSSMLPAIRPGDILAVHRRQISETQLGDIAFFSCYGGVVAHRIISKGQDFFIAQGDSVPSPDNLVTTENFLGLVVSIERDGKSFVPSLYPGALSGFMATVLKRSYFATRIWLAVWTHIRALRDRSKSQLHTVTSSSLTASS